MTRAERRDKPCEHHTWEREDAVSADGMCPFCLADELAALRSRVAELEHALDAEQLGAEKAQARIAELELELAGYR